jgi:predicted CoA-binding protein
MARILRSARVIAVVGLSSSPARDSHEVGAYLQRQGYQVIPVNPQVSEVLGERSYPSLREVPVRPDLAVVFRRPEALAGVVEDALSAGIPALWTQLGVVDEAALRRARVAGLQVVADRCVMVEHRRLRGQLIEPEVDEGLACPVDST